MTLDEGELLCEKEQTDTIALDACVVRTKAHPVHVLVVCAVFVYA